MLVRKAPEELADGNLVCTYGAQTRGRLVRDMLAGVIRKRQVCKNSVLGGQISTIRHFVLPLGLSTL